MSSDLAAFQRLHPAEYYRKFLQSGGVRPDGRAPAAFRKVTVGDAQLDRSCAVASALVKLGGTSVIVGISLKLEERGASAAGVAGAAASNGFTPLAISVMLSKAASPRFSGMQSAAAAGSVFVENARTLAATLQQIFGR